MFSAAFPTSVQSFHAEENRKGQAWLYENSHLYLIEDGKYVFIKTDDDLHAFALLENLNVVIRLTDDDIEALKAKKRFTVRRFHFLAPTTGALPADIRTVSDLDSADQRVLFMRQFICDAILTAQEHHAGFALSDDSLNAKIKSVWSDWDDCDTKATTVDGRSGSSIAYKKLLKPAASTVRTWLRRYKAANFDVMALANNYGRSGNRETRFGKEEQNLLSKFAQRYMSAIRPTKAMLYRDLCDLITALNIKRMRSGKQLRQLATPSRRAFERKIDRLDPFQVLAARHGEDYAKRKLGIVNKGLTVHRPMERVEMDEWTIPLQTLLMNADVWSKMSPEAKKKAARQRLYLSTGIDARTRIVTACKIVFTPSGSTAVATAQMCVSDKTAIARAAGAKGPWNHCGVYESATTDGGSSWLDFAFRAANVDMGARLHITPAKTPQQRAREERLYRTLHDMLIARFSGRSFANSVVKGDYDSEGNAVIDYEELGRAIVRFVVDVYHLTPHAGLNGATPHDTWVELRQKYRVLPPLDVDTSRHVFGVTMERRIGGHGIRVLGLNYQSEDVQRLRSAANGKKVMLRVDPENLGYISAKTADGWITVKCQRKGFDGVSMVQWIMTAMRLKKENLAKAKVHEPTVRAAMAAIRGMAESSIRRAGIASPVISRADLERFDRDLFRTFRIDASDDVNVMFLGSETETVDPATGELTEVPVARVKDVPAVSLPAIESDYAVED